MLARWRHCDFSLPVTLHAFCSHHCLQHAALSSLGAHYTPTHTARYHRSPPRLGFLECDTIAWVYFTAQVYSLVSSAGHLNFARTRLLPSRGLAPLQPDNMPANCYALCLCNYYYLLDSCTFIVGSDGRRISGEFAAYSRLICLHFTLAPLWLSKQQTMCLAAGTCFSRHTKRMHMRTRRAKPAQEFAGSMGRCSPHHRHSPPSCHFSRLACHTTRLQGWGLPPAGTVPADSVTLGPRCRSPSQCLVIQTLPCYLPTALPAACTNIHHALVHIAKKEPLSFLYI